MDSHACSSIAEGNLILLAESFSLDLHSAAWCLALANIGRTLQGGSLISHQLLATDRHGNILTRETSDSWCCCCRKGGIMHLLTPTMQGRALCQPFQLSMRASRVEGADRAACASPSTLCDDHVHVCSSKVPRISFLFTRLWFGS